MAKLGFVTVLLGWLATLFRRPLLLVLLTVGIIALLVLTRPRLEPVVLEERSWPVEVVVVQPQDEQPVLELYGEVVAGRRSELRALVPGAIVNVSDGFREGAAVRAGDLLVQIDPFTYQNDVTERQALLNEAEVSLRTAERNLQRIRDLYAAQNVSEQNLDDAALALEQQSSLLEQRRVALRRAERALQDTRLVAPYDGILYDVSANLGKQLGVNDKVADIIDTGQLEIRFTLSNAQFGRIVSDAEGLEGRPVDVIWNVGGADRHFQATVERVGGEIDATTGGVNVFATVQGAEQGTLLRPGAFVQVRIPDRVYSQVFRAPDSALYGADSVFVVHDGRLAARKVEVMGHDGDDMLFVAAPGSALQAGDQVVITQLREGGDGMRVELR